MRREGEELSGFLPLGPASTILVVASLPVVACVKNAPF